MGIAAWGNMTSNRFGDESIVRVKHFPKNIACLPPLLFRNHNRIRNQRRVLVRRLLSRVAIPLAWDRRSLRRGWRNIRTKYRDVAVIGPRRWLDSLPASIAKIVVGGNDFVVTPGQPTEAGAVIAWDAMERAAAGA